MLNNPIHIFAGEKRSRIDLYCFQIGKDFQILLLGGAYHIGAVSLGTQVKDNGRIKTGISILSTPGHREDEITQRVTRQLCGAISANFAVTSGIHYDDLSKAELDIILKNINYLCAELIEILANPSKGQAQS